MIVRGAAAPGRIPQAQYNINMQKRRKVSRKVKNKYEEWKTQRVECLLCGQILQNASLQRHMKTQYTAAASKYRCKEVFDATADTFSVCFIKGRFLKCPVDGCDGVGRDKSGLYRHFAI